MRIALLEDDPAQADLILALLKTAEHQISHQADAESFLKLLRQDSFDLCIIDWVLPESSGFEVLQWIRTHIEWPIPILFVTSLNNEENIVKALEAGADDYMVKPIKQTEMLAQINALARRSQLLNQEDELLAFGEFQVNRKTHTISRQGKSIDLTAKEYELALFLFRNAGRLMSRNHILETVWGHKPTLNTRTIDTHISRIRSKLPLNPTSGWRLSTLYQHGYRLENQNKGQSGINYLEVYQRIPLLSTIATIGSLLFKHQHIQFLRCLLILLFLIPFQAQSHEWIYIVKTSDNLWDIADASRLLIHQQTEVVLDTISAYQHTGMVDSRLRIIEGYVDTQVQPKQGPGSKYQISTPFAVAAVRGTDFRISASALGDFLRSEVLEGSVGVSAKGVKRNLKQGYGLTVEKSKAPSKPKRLLPPPDTSSLPGELIYFPLHLNWPDLSDAVQYRIQVADNIRFEKLHVDTLNEKSAISLPKLAEGEYVMRIRGVDDTQLEGLNALHPFKVDARPEAPLPLNPINNSTIYQAQPKFWWSIPEQTVAYHFQFASDKAFTNLLVDLASYKESSTTPEQALEPGQYYWRVASYDDTGAQGPYAPSQTVTIKAKPAAPEAGEPGIDENQINFQWKADPEAAHYHFQLSEDEDFEEFFVDQQLENNIYSIPLTELTSYTYYFRIKTINKDNIAGPFCSIQKVEIPRDKSSGIRQYRRPKLR